MMGGRVRVKVRLGLGLGTFTADLTVGRSDFESMYLMQHH